MNKIWGFVLAFVAGVIAVFAWKSRTNSYPDQSPFDDSIDSIQDDLADIAKKEEDLKENGVEDLTPEEEINYWKHN